MVEKEEYIPTKKWIEDVLSIPNIAPVLQLKHEHLNSVDTVSINPVIKGQCVSGSHDKTMKLWDLNKGVCLSTIKGHKAGIWGTDINKDGKLIASGSPDTTVRLWDYNKGKEVGLLQGHTKKVYCVRFDNTGTKVISSGADRLINLWDIKKPKKPLLTFKMEGAIVTSCAFMNNDKCIAATTFEGDINLFDITTNDKISYESIDTEEEYANSVFSVKAFNKPENSKKILTGSMDKIVRRWEINDYDSLEQRQQIPGHSSGVRFVATSADDEFILSGCMDHSSRIWDMKNSCPLGILFGHTDFVTGCEFMDSNTAVTASWDQSINVYKFDTHELKTRAKSLFGDDFEL